MGLPALYQQRRSIADLEQQLARDAVELQRLSEDKGLPGDVNGSLYQLAARMRSNLADAVQIRRFAEEEVARQRWEQNEVAAERARLWREISDARDEGYNRGFQEGAAGAENPGPKGP